MAQSIEQRGHHVTCTLIGTSRQWAAYNYMSSLALWKTLEDKLVDANRGIQKVRVEPATRSVVATWKFAQTTNTKTLLDRPVTTKVPKEHNYNLTLQNVKLSLYRMWNYQN